MIPDDDLFTDPLDLAALADASEAIQRLDRLVQAGRGGVRARLGLGLALIRAGDAAAAVAALQEAAFLAPDDAAVRTALGAALLDLGDHRAAIGSLQHALRLSPDAPEPALRLGMAWEALGERDRALGFYAQAGEAGAAPAAVLRAAPPAARHTPSFVRHLFDSYAATYDTDMLGTLGYRGPELLLAAVSPWLGAPAAALSIADLGCGTGLCGPLLRPWALRIDGVDLSPAMLAAAARTGAYDGLHDADIVDWLAPQAGAFDLLVAADVLNYLGDLAPLFAAAADALRPGGWFAFSVEAGDDRGWSLGPKRRFRHAAGYVADVAAGAGLAIAASAPVVPRREAGIAVDALMFVASRP